MQLATTPITAAGAEPTRWMLFLHGILGTGANWTSIARKFVEAQPAWGALLVDLRGHGRSGHAPPPHTVLAAAEDLSSIDKNREIRAVLGHSFGGKVALAYAKTRIESGSPLETVWSIDSAPGARPDRDDDEGATETIRMVRGLSFPFPTRQAFVEAIVAQGHSQAFAGWLAMSLTRAPDGGFIWGLDLDLIEALLADYFARDLWSVIESPSPTRFEMVLGTTKKSVWRDDERARLEALTARDPGRVHAHPIEGAGHWVHVDRPDALLSLLTADRSTHRSE